MYLNVIKASKKDSEAMCRVVVGSVLIDIGLHKLFQKMFVTKIIRLSNLTEDNFRIISER